MSQSKNKKAKTGLGFLPPPDKTEATSRVTVEVDLKKKKRFMAVTKKNKTDMSACVNHWIDIFLEEYDS